jgi:hypothetical protein
MTLIYSFLELPKLNDSLIDSAFTSVKNKERENRVNPNLFSLPGYQEYKDRTLTRVDGTTVKSAAGYRYWVGEEFKDWVFEHFNQDDRGCGVNIFNSPNANVVAPHVDASRSFSIHYLLDEGGDNVDTIWWQEKNHSLIRPDLKGNFNLKDCVDNYNRLEEIIRIQVPKHRWILMNVDVLHSVEIITRPRISIQISRNSVPENIKLIDPYYAVDQ